MTRVCCFKASTHAGIYYISPNYWGDVS